MKMKRLLVITVLAVLLASTLGATAAVAEPKGQSSIYQFKIAATDSNGAGKLMINLYQHMFVFNGKGFVPGKTYWLWCDASGPHTLGSVVADPEGNVALTGRLADNVNWAPVTGASIFSATLNVKPTLDTAHNVWTFAETATWSGGVAPVTVRYSLQQNGVTLDDRIRTTSGAGSATSFILGESHFPPGSGTVVFTITLTDALGQTVTDSIQYTI